MTRTERNAEIVRLYEEGLTYTQIAEKLRLDDRNVVAGVVHRWRRRTGAQARGLTDAGRKSLAEGWKNRTLEGEARRVAGVRAANMGRRHEMHAIAKGVIEPEDAAVRELLARAR